MFRVKLEVRCRLNRQRKSSLLFLFSAFSIAASVVLFYLAETGRYMKMNERLLEEAKQRTHGKISFGIYPPIEDLTWYTEDYLAIIFFFIALTTLIYGMWLRKSEKSRS